MTNNKPSSILMNKLSKNIVEQTISKGSKDLVLLNYKGGRFYTYKNKIVDLSDKSFKLIDLKFFHVLNEDKKLWYKSNLIEDLSTKEVEFRRFKDKDNKLKINNSTIINIEDEEVKNKYNTSLKIILFLQCNNGKLYTVTASKTNIKLLRNFGEKHNFDYENIIFNLGSTVYTEDGYDFSVLEYNLNDKDKIETKDLTNEMKEFIKIYNL